MANSIAGFREIEHTADWELAVWAPDIAGLLEQAAYGMYSLSETRLEPGHRQVYEIILPASELETLLVSFLSELLWIGEQESWGFDSFVISFRDGEMHARLEGAAIASQTKVIKAVTYHNLNIQRTKRGLEASVVFDV